MPENKPIKAALTVKARRLLLIREFWSIVLPLVATPHPRWAGASTSASYWIGASSYFRGLRYDLTVRGHNAGCMLYIDASIGKHAWNKAMFDALDAKRADIEAALGDRLVWCRLNDKNCAAVASIAAKPGFKSPREQWPEIANKLIDQVRRFPAALQPHLEEAADV